MFSMSTRSRDGGTLNLPTEGRSLHVPDQRTCTRCKHFRLVTDFTLMGKGVKRRTICRMCESEQKRILNYNLDDITYQAILHAQNNSCAICYQPFGDSPPNVDHDHLCCPGKRSCGKCIRGLLCGHCNKAVGLFEDDPDTLYSAARYLTRKVEYQ